MPMQAHRAAAAALLLLCPLAPAQEGERPAASQPAARAIPADKDVVTTKSGLKYSVLTAGEPGGAHPKLGDTVRVHYTGWLTTGKVFDSSVGRGEPAEFMVGTVIEGWNEAVVLMTKGARIKATIPPELGYRDEGAGQDIPPNATLVFDIRLNDIVVSAT